MDEKTFESLPAELTLREIQFTVSEKGKRAKQIILITSLLDAELSGKAELAELYNIRWCAEIDLRSFQTVMEMDVLRCKTPEMVRKEIWTHLLDAIVSHQVGNRPGRYEPRAKKRRPKPYKLLQIPRKEARKRKPGKAYD